MVKGRLARLLARQRQALLGSDAGFYHDGFELVENQGQLRAAFATQPEMRDPSRAFSKSRELIRWRLWSYFKLEETTIPQESEGDRAIGISAM